MDHVATQFEATTQSKPFFKRKKVRKFSLGVMEKITASVLFAALAAFAGGLAVHFYQIPADPIAYIDPDTGCQYLMTNASITPRLDRDGTPLC